MKAILYTLLAGLIVGIGLGIWAVFVEPGRVRFQEYPVYVKGWPEELAGFSVVFITDTHVGSPHITLDKLRWIVAEANARQPDMVLLGGDYVIQGVLGGTPVASRDIVEVLSGLRARHGVYGVLGNHDWWENALRMEGEFAEQQVTMLEDKAVHVQVDRMGFWLAGISDYTEGAHDVGKALAAVSGTEPVIALTHSPDVFPEIPATVALTLAGHTHGGQVYIPLLGRLVVPSKYGARYAIGLIHENGKQLFVGPGVGTSILPIRFLTPPEVSVLKLYPAKK